MPKTYLFYDIETSGLNKAFDQVLQFAAIRTDEQLNELERHEFLVRLNPDVIPTPQAIITNRISINKLQQEGIPEPIAIEKIHQLLNTPGTISLGYNTLGFDDEFLRFSFHKNLLPPYTHQYANFCGRADLYPITIMYYLYKKDILNWPTINNKPSLKLEQLNLANKFANGVAHNAMVDVEVTLALARCLQKETQMWNYTLGYFDKNTDNDRTRKLPEQNALLIDGSCGANSNYQCFALSLGYHNHYKNQTLWLRLDKPELITTTPESIAKTSWVINKKFGEPPLLLPNIERFNKYITEEQKQLIAKNTAWLKHNLELFQQITTYYKEYTYPRIPNLDIDAALYQNGFLSDQEQYLCRQFHQASWDEKIKLLDTLTDTALQQQAMRIIGRYDSDALPDKYHDEFLAYLSEIKSPRHPMLDYRSEPRTTVSDALTNITLLKNDGKVDEQQLALLNELEDYLM